MIYTCMQLGSKAVAKPKHLAAVATLLLLLLLPLLLTWLRSEGDEAKCATLTLPCFCFKSFPRKSGSGGGLAVLHRTSLTKTLQFLLEIFFFFFFLPSLGKTLLGPTCM